MQELKIVLQQYLDGIRSVSDVLLWVSQFDWDSSVEDKLRNQLARLELLAFETAEKLRPEQDLIDEAVYIVSGRRGAVLVGTNVPGYEVTSSATNSSSLTLLTFGRLDEGLPEGRSPQAVSV